MPPCCSPRKTINFLPRPTCDELRFAIEWNERLRSLSSPARKTVRFQPTVAVSAVNRSISQLHWYAKNPTPSNDANDGGTRKQCKSWQKSINHEVTKISFSVSYIQKTTNFREFIMFRKASTFHRCEKDSFIKKFVYLKQDFFNDFMVPSVLHRV